MNDVYTSRILVAGGGGGVDGFGGGKNGGYGAAGGGIYSGNNTNFDTTIYGGTQTTGTENGVGEDGRDGKSNVGGAEGNGGCGGGYRGGKTIHINDDHTNIGGSGGSSYISGHPFCATYPSIFFSHTSIQIGTETFLDPNDNLETGHYGNGHARITRFIAIPEFTCSQNSYNHFIVNFIIAYFIK